MFQRIGNLNMKTSVVMIISMLYINAWSQASQPAASTPHTKQVFDGVWWLNSNEDERSGFIYGAGDCLTWTAHEQGFIITPLQVDDKITIFYKTHPKSKDLPVVNVWHKIDEQIEAISKPRKDTKEYGEVWTNAHGPLNGDWWGSISVLEETGYLEGYLWCNNNMVHPQKDSYSHSVNFYQKKINAYIDANHKSGDEAVANILRRYRDTVAVPAGGAGPHLQK